MIIATKQTELLKLQLVSSYIFIFVAMVLNTITHNQILNDEGKPPIYTLEESKEIEIACRNISLIILLIFLYINIENSKENQKSGFDIQIAASVLTVIAGALTLYNTYTTFNSSNLENPEL